MSVAVTTGAIVAGPGKSATNDKAYRAAERREQHKLGALAWPGLALIGIVALLPIAWLFWMSFLGKDGFTFEHYLRLLDENYVRTLQTTFEISFLVTFISVLIGYPLAYLISQVGPRLAAVLMMLVLFPVWTSLLVRCYAWLVLLQRRGVVNSWLQDVGLIDAPLRLMHNFTGTTIGMLHIMLPFMVLPLYASMKAINRDYMRAAANLGASPVRAFWGVYVPLTLPGLFAGIVIVFVLCLGFYVTPALLGGGRVYMWSMQIERNITYHADWGAASALGVILLIITLAILWGVGRVIGFGRIIGGEVMLGKPATETQITHLGRLWLYVLGGLAILFLILPSLLVIPLSFSDSRYLAFPPPGWSTRWYEAYFNAREWREATRTSFVAATLTMAISTVLGTLAAYSLHTAQSRLTQIVYATFMLPLIIPGILIAIGIFLLFARLGLNNTMTGLVLAHSVMAIPLVVITVVSGLKSYDMTQELAARSLGASRPWAFLTITLPQIKVSVISAALLAFITSLDEVVISLFIAGGDNATLTRRMFNALRDEIDPTIAAISTLLILVSVVLLGLTQLLQRSPSAQASVGQK